MINATSPEGNSDAVLVWTMLQSTLGSHVRTSRVPGGQSPGHFPRHRSEAVLERSGLFCLHAWGRFGKWRREGCALPRRASRGRPDKLPRALSLSLANTIVLSGDLRLACSGRDPSKFASAIFQLSFVICHRVGRPSRSSVHRASRTNGRPRSRYINATNRPAPK